MRPLFVGIGSPHGDDRIGWVVADDLARFARCGSIGEGSVAGPPVPAIRKASSPADLLDWLDDIDRLVVCDACRANGPPGTVSRWVWPEPPIEREHPSGTHQLGLASVLDLASVLGRLPGETVIWGVHIESLEQRPDLSDAVATALAGMVKRIWGDLTRA